MSGRSGLDNSNMLAAVVHEPGGPEVLKVEKRPIPKPVRSLSYESTIDDSLANAF